jgi:U3 small nucleolar ribonucleoprotein protein IMP4
MYRFNNFARDKRNSGYLLFLLLKETERVYLKFFLIFEDAIQICHLPYGPTAYFTLYNVLMRHDIENCGTMSEAYPHLIFNNFTSKLGKRCMDILKYLFPVPKEESKRVITFANEEDYILFRHYVYKKSAENKSEIELTEVGPRFDLKRKFCSVSLTYILSSLYYNFSLRNKTRYIR